LRLKQLDLRLHSSVFSIYSDEIGGAIRPVALGVWAAERQFEEITRVQGSLKAVNTQLHQPPCDQRLKRKRVIVQGDFVVRGPVSRGEFISVLCQREEF
jgi:hypothetical protein